MHRPARVIPFGAGYEQAKPAMDPQHAATKQLISDDYEKLQECEQASEARHLFKLGKHVPNNMPAKEGMGQQQLSHEKGDLPKKNRQDFVARGGRQKQLYLCSKRTTPQQAPCPASWPGPWMHETLPLGPNTSSPRLAQWCLPWDNHH